MKQHFMNSALRLLPTLRLFSAHLLPYNPRDHLPAFGFQQGLSVETPKQVQQRRHQSRPSRLVAGALAAAVRFPHYGSDAGFGNPCLRRCEKEASLSAACARSFTRESFSRSANGFAVSMRPSS
jgi:hypothetical protein